MYVYIYENIYIYTPICAYVYRELPENVYTDFVSLSQDVVRVFQKNACA